MIETPAVIDKADITPTHALVGRVNNAPCVIGDVEYAAGTLVFLDFMGARKDDGRYHGRHCFGKHPANTPCVTMDFADIPHFQERPKEEVSDELQSDS